MAMSLGSGKGVRAVINVTPLVDVVLVLLIIFMVVVPLLDAELGVSLPTDRVSPATPRDRHQIVMHLTAEREVYLNDVLVPRERVEGLLRTALRHDSERVVFFRADPDVEYGDAVALMDVAKGAGARTIGTVLTRSEGR